MFAQILMLLSIHRAGKLLIILEAFDEMYLVGNTQALMSHFQKLWQLARTPKSKIIITGRPNLFIDDERRRRALGITQPRNYLPYTHSVHLKLMNKDQIARVLRNVSAKISEQINSAVNETGMTSSFGELVRRPSTLFQLSVVWDKEFQEEGIDSINAAAVIGKFVQSDYDRQDSKFLEKGEKPIITSDERSYFMMGIAVGMMLNDGYSNQVSKKQLEILVRDLYNNYPPNLPPYKDSSKGIHSLNLLERLIDKEYPFETVLSNIIASGILVLDLNGSDVFKFSHKSYLEYLVSQFYTSYLLDEEKNEYDSMVIYAIQKCYNFKESSLTHSPDVDNFAAQLIANRIKVDFEAKKNILSPISDRVIVRAIYKKLFPKFYSLLLPKFQSWLSFHPSLLRLQFLSIALVIVLYLFLFNQEESNDFFKSNIYVGLTVVILIYFYVYLLFFSNGGPIFKPLQSYSKTSYQNRLGLFRLTISQIGLKDNSYWCVSRYVFQLLDREDQEFNSLLHDLKVIKLGVFLLPFGIVVILLKYFELLTVSTPRIFALLSFLFVLCPSILIILIGCIQLINAKWKNNFIARRIFLETDDPLNIFIVILEKGGMNVILSVLTIYFLFFGGVDSMNYVEDGSSASRWISILVVLAFSIVFFFISLYRIKKLLNFNAR